MSATEAIHQGSELAGSLGGFIVHWLEQAFTRFNGDIKSGAILIFCTYLLVVVIGLVKGEN